MGPGPVLRRRTPPQHTPMKTKILWRLAATILLLGWSIGSLFPLKDIPLDEFLVQQAAPEKQAALKDLLGLANARAKEMDAIAIAKNPNAPRTSLFLGLRNVLLFDRDDATSKPKHDLSAYFPQYNVRGIKNPDKRNTELLKYLLANTKGKIKLGLDLNGGVAVTYRIKADTEGNAPDQEEITKALDVIKDRVDAYGLAEPVVRPLGTDRIEVQLPGIKASDNPDLIEQIGKPARLEFCDVHPTLSPSNANDRAPAGYRTLILDNENDDGTITQTPMFVSRVTAMDGSSIAKAYPAQDPTTMAPYVSIEFTNKGASEFGDLTAKRIHKPFAIVLDGKLMSAPTIQSEIRGGHAQITGNFTRQEVQELVNVLNNPLKVGLEVADQFEVSASLAEDSMGASVNAAYIGSVVVFAFMGFYYYRHANGLIVSISLVTTMTTIIGVMVGLGAAMSLPGIAGLVLTVGMAVDAQILIFERLREEMEKGLTFKQAINLAYEKAFSTIFDANITTLLTSVILIVTGNGPVRGFGITLTIGIIASMFGALVTTRALQMLYCYSRGLVWAVSVILNAIILAYLLWNDAAHNDLVLAAIGAGGVLAAVSMAIFKYIHGRKEPLPFVRYGKPAFITSWIIVLTGIGFIVARWDRMWSPDFVGGDEVSITFVEKSFATEKGLPPAPEEVETKVRQGLGKDAFVTAGYVKVLGADKQFLRLQTTAGNGPEVVKALKAAYPKAEFTEAGTSTVGPSVGRDTQVTALISMGLATLGIMVYVGLRFEWGYGMGAVVSTVHDVIMTIGCYVMVGGQFSAPMVAAILMVIGYSINDTIVVFDRIREELTGNPDLTLAQIIDKAITTTLSRTILTVGTTLFSTLALYLFGAGIVVDFSLVFLFGLITGTFSSIYIAPPVFYYYYKGRREAVEADKDVLPTYEWEAGAPAKSVTIDLEPETQK